jgi:hypothetical protein
LIWDHHVAAAIQRVLAVRDQDFKCPQGQPHSCGVALFLGRFSFLLIFITSMQDRVIQNSYDFDPKISQITPMKQKNKRHFIGEVQVSITVQ